MVVVIGVFGGVVMMLWNWVMLVLFVGVWMIDFVYVLGLFVLSCILFGGFCGYCGWYGWCYWCKWEVMMLEECE